MDHIVQKIAHDEWKYNHHQAFNWMALYVLPVVIAILICLIYQHHVLVKMPTVIVDQDKTITSLRLTRMLDQHRFIHVNDRTDQVAEGIKAIRTRKAYALIIIPRDFEKNWKSGQQPVIRGYSYGTNLVVGKSIQKAIVETVNQVSSEIVVGKLAVMRHESTDSKANFPPLNLDVHNLYNPGYNYQWFLPPGAIISILQMLIVMLGATAFCSKKRNPGSSEISSFFQLYIGKSIPIIIIYTLQGLFIWLVLFPLLGIPVRGNLLIGLLLWEAFIITSYTIGFSISAMIKDSMIATVASIFIMAPSFAFSGYTYPFWEMPLLHRIFALIMPSTHFLPAFLQFFLQGSALSTMFPQILSLCIFFLCIFLLLLISKFIHKCYPNGWERI